MATDTIPLPEQPKSIDLSHHLNTHSKARHPSPLKEIIKFMGYEGMVSLAGGAQIPQSKTSPGHQLITIRSPTPLPLPFPVGNSCYLPFIHNSLALRRFHLPSRHPNHHQRRPSRPAPLTGHRPPVRWRQRRRFASGLVHRFYESAVQARVRGLRGDPELREH